MKTLERKPLLWKLVHVVFIKKKKNKHSFIYFSAKKKIFNSSAALVGVSYKIDLVFVQCSSSSEMNYWRNTGVGHRRVGVKLRTLEGNLTVLPAYSRAYIRH